MLTCQPRHTWRHWFVGLAMSIAPVTQAMSATGPGPTADRQRAAAVGPIWVSDRVRVNGVRLELRSATLPIERSSLVARLASLWAVDSPYGALLQATGSQGGATVIGRQRGARHEVIRLQDATPGHTRVIVSATDLSRPAGPMPAMPYAPSSGHKLLSVIEADGTSRETTYVLSSPLETARAAWQLREDLRRSGWESRRSQVGRSEVQWAERDRQALEAVVLPEGPTSRIVLRLSVHAP